MGRTRRQLLLLAVATLLLGMVSVPTASSAAAGPALRWSRAHVDPARGGLRAVSCVSAIWCLAGDADGRTLRFDGRRWHKSEPLGEGTQLSGVRCTSTTFCAASVSMSGQRYRPATFDGTRWQLAERVPGFVYSAGVSCASSSFCVIVNAAGQAQRWTGHRWTQPRTIDRSSDGWMAVSCVTAHKCFAGDAIGGILRYNGTGWTRPRYLDPGHRITSISCPTRRFCMATDDRGDWLRHNGRRWSSPRRFDAPHRSISVSCSSARFCVAVDTSGYTATFGGRHWSRMRRTAPFATPNDVSCIGPRLCVLVTREGYAKTRVRGTWGRLTSVDPALGSPWAVSCATTQSCRVGDLSGATLTLDGTTWSTPRRVPRNRDGIDELSCPVAGYCKAFGGFGNVYTRSHGRWHGPVHLRRLASRTLSCTSRSFCMTVNYVGQAVRFTGSWSRPTRVFSSSDFGVDVSCTGRGFCLAISGDGFIAKYTGSWASPRTPVSRPNAVSCVSRKFCMVVTESGHSAIRTAHGWRAGPSAQAHFRDVSCTTTRFCMAVSGRRAYQYNGSSWRQTLSLQRRNVLSSVSCAGTTLCLAPDWQTGDVYVAR